MSDLPPKVHYPSQCDQCCALPNVVRVTQVLSLRRYIDGGGGPYQSQLWRPSLVGEILGTVETKAWSEECEKYTACWPKLGPVNRPIPND